MFKVLMIGFGGFLGSIMRYLSSEFVNSYGRMGHFPFGTFFVNMVGCFFMGYLSQLFLNKKIFSSEVESLILIGFLGSFTTYSSFSNESFRLFQKSEHILAILNIGLHLLFGLIALFMGIYFSEILHNDKKEEEDNV